MGAVYPSIRHDETEPMLDNQNARTLAHHPPGFAENYLDQPRVLGHFSGELLCLRGSAHVGKIHIAALGFGNDLLRDDEYVTVIWREVVLLAGGHQQGGEIIAR